MPRHHTYVATTSWDGTTADGYAAYDRTHDTATTPETGPLRVTADTPFRGEPGIHNPEQLVVIAASSCQMLSFLALAARDGVDVRSYRDTATGIMPKAGERTSLTEITLTPQITIAGAVDEEALHRMVRRAHDGCYIANSLRTTITIAASFLPAPTSG